MKICVLTSGHDVYDNRIYYKQILSLKNKYDNIYLVAPGEKDFITEDGIIVKCFKKRESWYDRIRPMKEMFKIANSIKAEIYHAHEPDSFQVAVKLKKTTKCKIIYDSHEYHPEGFSEHFKYGKKIIEKMVYQYEKKIAKKADYIISVNSILVNKFKGYNSNVALIPNYPVIYKKDFNKVNTDVPTFVYVGGLTQERGIFKIVESIKYVNKPCKFLFVGSFENEKFKIDIEDYIYKNLKDKKIIFTGKIQHKEVFKYLEQAVGGFVVLQPTNWRYVNSEPIKLFEYMMTKTPIIASNFPMMKKIVEESGCGVLVNPTDISSIANAINYFLDNPQEVQKLGKCGFEKVKELYNWEVCEKELLNVYDKLVKSWRVKS